MADVTFFKLGINGKIIDIVSVDENDCKDANNNFDENIGTQFLNNLTGWPLWISKKDRLGIPELNGYFLEDYNVFKCTPIDTSFVFDPITATWDHPTNPKPTNNTITHNGIELTLTPYWAFERWQGSQLGYKQYQFYWNTDTNSWTLIT